MPGRLSVKFEPRDEQWPEETGNIVERPRQFHLAVQSLYAQALTSSVSTEDLTADIDPPTSSRAATAVGQRGMTFTRGESIRDVIYYAEQMHFGHRGRGRHFIPQEVLDRPIRRPGPPVAPSVVPDVADDHTFAEFEGILDGRMDDFTIYKKLENYIFKEARGLADLEKMMKFICFKALESTVKAPTVCKYLYVFSQDPTVRENLQTAFFGKLEKDFMGRSDILMREGPVRYRNFIRWIMAVAHHFRNPLYAPFDELMLGLNELAREISNFNDPDDYRLFAQLNIRFYYYASLPCSNGESVPALLGEKYSGAIKSAQSTARSRLIGGTANTEHRRWLLLLLEVTRSSPKIDDELVDAYKSELPGFDQLMPAALTITLPPNSGRDKYLTHIRQYIKS